MQLVMAAVPPAAVSRAVSKVIISLRIFFQSVFIVFVCFKGFVFVRCVAALNDACCHGLTVQRYAKIADPAMLRLPTSYLNAGLGVFGDFFYGAC